MARKVEYEKDYIINKSIDFIKEKGIDKLSSRELTKYIGCSTQPIFRLYNNMDLYKRALRNRLNKDYTKFTEEFSNKPNTYLYLNYAYVLYAKKEHDLFKALFLSDISNTNILKNDKKMISLLKKEYNLSEDKAKSVYRDVKTYTHGIAMQICLNQLNMSDKDLLFLINNCIKRNVKE